MLNNLLLNYFVKYKEGVKLNKNFMKITIILIALSNFTLKTDNFELKWIGAIEVVSRIIKQYILK